MRWFPAVHRPLRYTSILRDENFRIVVRKRLVDAAIVSFVEEVTVRQLIGIERVGSGQIPALTMSSLAANIDERG
ncbi:hypothetical protein OK016_02410 [Vibrio chagasii]|nr:hypothetical protein [Vibrio chagasii]